MNEELPGQYIQVKGLLNTSELQVIGRILDDAAFVDGKATASDAAKGVKNNLQLPEGPALNGVQQIINQAIMSNTLIQTAVMPVMTLPVLVSRYSGGMSYGWHVDSPLMGSPTIRTDVGMTIFLSDPTSYEGGELAINSPSGTISVKLSKGDAVIYPTTRLHGVAPVDKGSREVAVTWMQCAVRNSDQRELLFQLRSVQESIYKQSPDSKENQLLQQIYSNLLRQWVNI